MGTALRNNTVISFNQVATAVCGIAVLVGIGTQVTVYTLDKATAHQCANHDWPKQAHDIHMDWCAANSYPTN
jgi:hypothetical protein